MAEASREVNWEEKEEDVERILQRNLDGTYNKSEGTKDRIVERIKRENEDFFNVSVCIYLLLFSLVYEL